MDNVKVVFLPYYRGKSVNRRMTFGQFGAHKMKIWHPPQKLTVLALKSVKFVRSIVLSYEFEFEKKGILSRG